MADDNNNQELNPDGTPKVPVNPSIPPKEPTPPEPTVPLSRFREVNDKVKTLEEKLAQVTPKEPVIPDDEQKMEQTLSKIEQRRIEQAKKEKEQLRKELDELHTIHGEFDEEKLLKVVDDYGVYDESGNVRNWEKALELLDRISQNPEYKPKINLPKGGDRGGKPPEVVPPVDVKGKSLFELAHEGLKKFGL
jgi:hypothetical protein